MRSAIVQQPHGARRSARPESAPKAVRRTQRERSELTIASIVAVARDSFVRDGYAAANLDEISATAQVTKGALYHHFKGKAALFCEVYECEQRSIMQAIVAAQQQAPDAWSGFRAGVQALLSISCRPDVQRITLVDAPAVIAWQTRREIDNRYLQQVLERGLRLAIDDGWIESRPIPPLASFLCGGMREIVVAVAHSDQPVEARAAAEAELDRIIDALAGPGRVAAEAAQTD